MPVRTKRGKKRATSRKRAAPRRRTTATKKRAKKTTVNKNILPEQRQLTMYHDPFSRATKQPKIPDGKVTESLGFQTQAVLETVAVNGGDGILHFLLYPGTDAGLVISGDALSGGAFVTPANQNNVVAFTGSNGVDWSAISSTGGDVTDLDKYAQWRTVSAGLRLSLLNPQEEDDGWWEACRVIEANDPLDYDLTSKNSTANRSANGTIAPTRLLQNLKGKNLVNERSYATGLLRDVKNHVFSLHGIKDEHDFKEPQTTFTFTDADILAYNPVDIVGSFASGSANAMDYINQRIDPSYDMIYVRCYGRNAGNLSRLHCNVVSNQEITFSNEERESRFHTASGSIGAAMNDHVHAKRSFGSASNVVPM